MTIPIDLVGIHVCAVASKCAKVTRARLISGITFNQDGSKEAHGVFEITTVGIHHRSIPGLIESAPELFTFAKEMRGYLDLKLSQFRQDYPENHCIVDTAKRYLAQCDAVIAKVERGIK